MSSWRTAKCLNTLLEQVNAAYPGRDKSSDGTIGDNVHATRHSEHNPDENGVVRAMDITNDPAHGLNSRTLAEALINSRDNRILYVISNAQICSSVISPWVWRAYHGENDHRHHMHLSVVEDPKLYDDTRKWDIGPKIPTPIVAGTQTGKGSWYSQYKGRYTWVDTGDAPGSAALGCPDDAQGIALYSNETLGHWFEVTAPNGVTSIEQQTDIGPHPRTGRKIDISSAAAERFGYSPKNFPTDGTFKWSPTEVPKEVAGLSAKEQAAKYRDLRKITPTPPPAPSGGLWASVKSLFGKIFG